MTKKSKQNFNKTKDILFILSNFIIALFAAYWAAKLIDLNVLSNNNDIYVFSLFIGGFFGSILTIIMRLLLKGRRCYHFHYMLIAMLATSLFSGSISFILNAFILATI